jgi:hypothetical protein
MSIREMRFLKECETKFPSTEILVDAWGREVDGADAWQMIAFMREPEKTWFLENVQDKARWAEMNQAVTTLATIQAEDAEAERVLFEEIGDEGRG